MEYIEAFDAIFYNNEGISDLYRGAYKSALKKFKKAVAIKVRVHGENSVHVCISLSGLCDAYLKLNDIEKATAEARRMLIIAEVIQSDEQIRIAKEILDDCTMLSEI